MNKANLLRKFIKILYLTIKSIKDFIKFKLNKIQLIKKLLILIKKSIYKSNNLYNKTNHIKK